MRNNRHLYHFLYQSLATQIECGYLLPGQPLPSQSDLCRQYNAGITTVRRVEQMLAKAGYISPCSGKTPEVVYQGTPLVYASNILERRDGIMDAHMGISALMPVICVESARLCGPRELSKLRMIRGALHGDLTRAEVFEILLQFFSKLCSTLQNLLIMDLASDAGSYLSVPFLPFTGIVAPSAYTADVLYRRLGEAIDMIEARSYGQFHRFVQEMYARWGESLTEYMNSLEKTAQPKAKREKDLSWFRSRGRSELYVQVALSLIRRITSGEFDHQKYMPSIPAIMEEYGIMKDTACRAVSFLNLMGVASTLDKKGTITTPQSLRKISLDLNTPLIQKRLRLFLDAMQVFAITGRTGASLIFPLIRQEHLTELEEQLDHMNDTNLYSLSFRMIAGSLIRLSPSHSLRNIYSQLYEVMLWGYYLQSVDRLPYMESDNIRRQTFRLVEALKAGDKDSFLDAVEYILTQTHRETSFLLKRDILAPLPKDGEKEL